MTLLTDSCHYVRNVHPHNAGTSRFQGPGSWNSLPQLVNTHKH